MLDELYSFLLAFKFRQLASNMIYILEIFSQKIWSFFDLLQKYIYKRTQTHEKNKLLFVLVHRHQCPMTIYNDTTTVDKDKKATFDFRYSAELSRPWLLGMGTIPGWLGSKREKIIQSKDNTQIYLPQTTNNI